MKYKEIEFGRTDIEVIDGDRGKKYPHQNELLNNGFCVFLSASNVTVSGFKFDSVVYITKEKDEQLKNGKLSRNDIVITTRGTVGNVALFDSDIPFNEMRINSGMLIIRCHEMVDYKYLYYVLRGRGFQQQIRQIVTGSAQPQLPKSHLLKMLIAIPPLSVQKQISSILDKIDKKIANNNRINDNLEAQLSSLFIHNFSDAVASADIGACPMLGDLITVIDNRGKTPPLTTETIDYPIIDVGALKGFGRIVDFNNCTKYVTKTTYDSWFRSGHPQPWDILISTVGSLAEIKIYLGSKGCIAQNVVALRAKSISPLYLYQYLRFIRAGLVAYNIGSVQPSIKVTHIIKHPIFVPETSKLKEFEEVARVITNRLYTNYNECESLKKLRDTLLPKLMSGELDVSNLNL